MRLYQNSSLRNAYEEIEHISSDCYADDLTFTSKSQHVSKIHVDQDLYYKISLLGVIVQQSKTKKCQDKVEVATVVQICGENWGG